MAFSEYYQRELNYLLEMGHEFGKRHSNARHLGQRSNNPYAERILEGVAFLTAKLHERIDGAFPEIIEPILEMVAPQFLAPLPSCTIVEFSPKLSAARAAKTLAAGTQVASKAHEATQRPSCVFQSTKDVELLPLRVIDASLERKPNRACTIRIEFETHEAGRIALRRADRLEFFVDGEAHFVGALLLGLERHCTKIGVAGVGALDPQDLRLPAFDAGRSLLPWSQRQTLRSHRMLAEFAVMPKAFSFLEIRGFSGLALQEDRFTLEIELEDAPSLPGNIDQETFHLHCVPAINLFSVPSEPLIVNALRSPRQIRAQEHGPHDIEVYDVSQVSAQPEGGGKSIEVRPYYAFSSTQAETSGGANFAVSRKASPMDDGVDTSLYFTNWSQQEQRERGAVQVVSMQLRCTNRHHPRELGVGDLCEQPRRGRRVPCSFRNIVAPTVPVRSGAGERLQWRLAAVMSTRRCNLQQVDQLRALVELYEEFGTLASRQGEAASLSAAIRSVKARAMVSPVRGEVWSGTEVEIELDARELEIGQAYMLARLLNEVFASDVALNSFVQLKVRCEDPISSQLSVWSFPRRFAARELA